MPESKKYPLSNIEKLCTKLSHLLVRRAFVKYKINTKQLRLIHFKLKVNKYFDRNVDKRKVRYFFDKMKINSLSRGVHDYMQDKFQFYLRYSRRSLEIYNKAIIPY